MSDGSTIRVGCRDTEFCRAQTTAVLDRLKIENPGTEFELVPLDGDDDALLEALAAGVCDLHVRAARDVPVDLSDELKIATCTMREEPFEVLIASEGDLLEDLPEGAVVGVQSVRVKVQLDSFREDLDLKIVDDAMDGFFDRLNKGELAAFVAAAEDIETCGAQESVAEVFPPDIILPAAGQGSFALLVRTSDGAAAKLALAVGHEVSYHVILAERAFLAELNVKTTHPVAVHGSFDEETLVLEAMLADEVSGAILRDDLDGEPAEKGGLGVRLAKLIMADGAQDYLASYK